MFSDNGFCNNGPHTAGPNDSHKRSDGMDEEEDEFTHPLILPVSKILKFQCVVDFARDRVIAPTGINHTVESIGYMPI